MGAVLKYDPVKNQTSYYKSGKLYKTARGDTTSSSNNVSGGSSNNSSSGYSGNSSNGASDSSSDYPTTGSIYMTRPDGSQLSTSASNLQEYLAKGYTYDGVRKSGSGSIQSRTGSDDSESNISDMYDEQRKSLIAQLKASIAKSKQGYSDIIGKAPQTYQPLRNQTAISKEQQLMSMREALGNSGDRGGIGRQDMLGVTTAAGNQMNAIDLQQQNVVNDANSAITSLDSELNSGIDQITADTASQKLQALLGEQARVDELNAEQTRYATEYADKQKQQEFENSNTLADREAEQADKALRTEIETMGRYFSDFQAEINRRGNTADKSDDALIPYLQAARAEKVAKQLADADNSASQAYKNAYNMWLQLGVATPEVARILGIEAGAKTLDKVKAEYSTNKPYYSPNSGGSSGSSGSTPKPKPFYLD